MPRTNRPSRVDANQKDIVGSLRRMGCNVLHLHAVGHGCPDILVGYHGYNVLMEIKAEGGKMTGDEIVFNQTWRGQVAIVRNIDDAMECLSRNCLQVDANKNDRYP